MVTEYTHVRYQQARKEWECILRVIEAERNQAWADIRELRGDLARADAELARLQEAIGGMPDE